MTQTQAASAPGQNVLTQCIGGNEDYVEPDMFFGVPKPGAVYMLCSDGLRHKVGAEEISGFLNPDAMSTMDEMKRQEGAIIECNKQRGETDNISVITVRTLASALEKSGFSIEKEIFSSQGSPLMWSPE
jgi:serine/threonine protein phosphatase PrpC